MDRAGYFLSTEDEPRVRRARDAVRIGGGFVLTFIAAVAAARRGPLQQAVLDVLEAVPDWTDLVLWVGYALAGVYAGGMFVAMIVRVRRNPNATRDVVLAAVVAAVIAILVMRWREGAWPEVLPEFGASDPEVRFPVIRVTVVTAVVIAVSPHVNRTLRRFGIVMVWLVALTGLGLGFGLVSDTLGGVGIGYIAAGAVLLVFGSPTGFPDVPVVAAALRELGVDVERLKPAVDQSWGMRRLHGFSSSGVPIEVKAYGRDAADTQLAGRLWRGVVYKGASQPFATRKQMVEHEALLALLAERAGVSVGHLLTAGVAGDDVAILAMNKPGVPMRTVSSDELEDDVLVSLWRDVSRLQELDISHGSLTLDAVQLTDEGHAMYDFQEGELAAGDRKHGDTVSLLFSSAGRVGNDRAISAARSGLGDEQLAAALPYFQLPVLPSGARQEAPKPKAFIAELRNAVADALDVDVPEPVRLQRVTLKSIAMAVLIFVAANALISQLADIDFVAVWDVVQDASWPLILAAYLFSHLNFWTEALSMQAAVGQPLPQLPLTLLQLAARFIGLAVPSAAGRVAMNSAFLIRFGVRPTVAVVQGAVDGVSGFLVEAGILLVALAFSDFSLDIDADVDWQTILLIALVVVVIGVLLILLVDRIRSRVVPVLKEALGTVWSVAKDPQRAMALLAANFGGRLVLGLTLWMVLRSMGFGLGIGTTLTVTVATNLLAGLVPVPGGIGVAEGVMMSWLVLAGVPEEIAFAATIVYRVATFYLPAVEGFFASKWLENRDYL